MQGVAQNGRGATSQDAAEIRCSENALFLREASLSRINCGKDAVQMQIHLTHVAEQGEER